MDMTGEELELNLTRTRYSNEAFDRLMVEQGRKTTWLAEQLDVDNSYVSKLRTGAKPLTDTLAHRISKILGVPVSYFIDDNRAA